MTPEEFSAQYMAHFSAQQKAAVQAVNGAVLLLAVPGSGKTTVLVTRLGYLALCCGVDPGSILVMTYTVAATQELRALCRAVSAAERPDAAVPHDQRPVGQDHRVLQPSARPGVHAAGERG